MDPTSSSPPQPVPFEKYEHAGGMAGAAEGILDLPGLAVAVAFLLPMPLAKGHLEAVQAVE